MTTWQTWQDLDNELGFTLGFKKIIKVRRGKLEDTGKADKGVKDNSVNPGLFRWKNGMGL